MLEKGVLQEVGALKQKICMVCFVVFLAHDFVFKDAGILYSFLPLLCELHIASGSRGPESSPSVVCNYYDILEAAR